MSLLIYWVRSLKDKIANDFDAAEQGEGLTAVVRITIDGQKSVDWGDNNLSEVTAYGAGIDVEKIHNFEYNRDVLGTALT